MPDTRAQVPDLVPFAAAARFLASCDWLSPDTPPDDEVLLTLAAGHSLSRGVGGHVALETLVLLISLTCAGPLESRLQSLFWALDKEGCGAVRQQQLARLVSPLLAIADAVPLLVTASGGSLQLLRCDSDGSRGGGGGSSSSRHMTKTVLDRLLLRCWAEQALERDSANQQQLVAIVLSGAAHLTAIMVDATFAAAEPPYAVIAASRHTSSAVSGGGGGVYGYSHGSSLAKGSVGGTSSTGASLQDNEPSAAAAAEVVATALPTASAAASSYQLADQLAASAGAGAGPAGRRSAERPGQSRRATELGAALADPAPAGPRDGPSSAPLAANGGGGSESDGLTDSGGFLGGVGEAAAFGGDDIAPLRSGSSGSPPQLRRSLTAGDVAAAGGAGDGSGQGTPWLIRRRGQGQLPGDKQPQQDGGGGGGGGGAGKEPLRAASDVDDLTPVRLGVTHSPAASSALPASAGAASGRSGGGRGIAESLPVEKDPSLAGSGGVPSPPRPTRATSELDYRSSYSLQFAPDGGNGSGNLARAAQLQLAAASFSGASGGDVSEYKYTGRSTLEADAAKAEALEMAEAAEQAAAAASGAGGGRKPAAAAPGQVRNPPTQSAARCLQHSGLTTSASPFLAVVCCVSQTAFALVLFAPCLPSPASPIPLRASRPRRRPTSLTTSAHLLTTLPLLLSLHLLRAGLRRRRRHAGRSAAS